MPINITSNYSNPQLAIMQRFQKTYKPEETPEKVHVKNNSHQHNNNAKDLSNINSNDIRDYLSNDEKKLLKEVFGDLNLDKISVVGYSATKFSDTLKGSQIDVKL